MKKHFSLFFLVIVIAGCMGAQSKISQDKINTLQKIVIIPLEPPPLSIPSVKSNDWSQDWADQLRFSQSLSMIPGSTTHAAGVIGMLASGIFAIIKSYEPPPDVKKELFSRDPLELKKFMNNAWIPTVFLAQEVENQLKFSGAFQISLTPKIYDVPGVSYKGTTLLMENWYQPLRQWWNSKTGLYDYSEFKSKGINGAIEVGLLNYEIEPFKLYMLMQVIVKLVDVETGLVFAKARDYKTIEIGDFKNLFSDDGKRFKDLFMTNGSILVSHNLKQMGLLIKQ